MRAYAYGGNSWSNRLWIGDWSYLPPDGPLQDVWGLSETDLAIGFLLIKSQPVIVIRRLQRSGERHYPYFLLIDPGEDVWTRFEWNGPAIALSLVGTEDAPGRDLLVEPEKCSESFLKDVLQTIKPVEFQSSCSAEALEFWSGAMLTEGLTVCRPEDAGLQNDNLLYQLAGMLAQLPLCIRNSGQWLSSGSRANAEYLNLQFVLDRNSEPPDKDILMMRLEGGRKFLSALRRLESDSEYRGSVASFINTPMWRWQKRFGAAPAQIIENIQLLAGLAGYGGEGSSTQTEIETRIISSGPLATEIRGAYRRALTLGKGPLGQERTRALISEYLAHRSPLDRGLQSRLSQEAVTDEIRKRGLKPSMVSLELPQASRLSLWLDFVNRKQKIDDLVALLEEAINDLLKTSHHGDHEEALEASADLIRAAITQSCEAVTIWSRMKFLYPDVVGHLSDWLQADWLQELTFSHTSGADWPREYLVFGNDPGGTLLASTHPEPELLHHLMAVFIREASGDGELKKEARLWIVALAASPLRMQIGLMDKLELVDIPDTGWANLGRIRDFVSGQSANLDFIDHVSDFELRCLFHEFREMVQPALQQKKSLLGWLKKLWKRTDRQKEPRPPVGKSL